MASPQVLPTQNDSGSFPSDEYSLLPEVEVPVVNMPNGDINHHKDCFNFTNMQSALTASSSPDSIAEVHSELSELREENYRLKEQLNKNNSMMEDQISTIQSWRDHMILSRNQLEENLKMSMEKISSLEKENSELLEKLEGAIKMNEKQKCNGLNSMLAIDYEEENGQIKQEWSYFHGNLQENLKCISQHLEIISDAKTNQEEKLLLDCYISMLKFKIASLDGDIGQLASLQTDEETGYEVVRLKTHKGEGTEQFHKVIEELRQKVKDKDNEVTCLKNEKEEFVEKIKDYEAKIQEWEMALKSQYELLNNKLQNESCLTQNYRERCESLQQQIEECQKQIDQNRTRMSDDRVIQELQEEIQSLQAILKLEQQTKEDDKEKLSAVMKKCENLQVDYDRVTKLLEIQSKDEKEKNEKLSLSESDAKKYMEEADHLTAKLLETQEKLEESEAEVKRLQDQLAQISEDTESIPILKTQIEMYKLDYHNLESAKNAAADEVERLENELRKYKKSDSSSKSHSPRRSPRRKSSDQRGQSGEAVAEFVCPVCTFGFTDENAAQNHINKCLEDNE